MKKCVRWIREKKKRPSPDVFRRIDYSSFLAPRRAKSNRARAFARNYGADNDRLSSLRRDSRDNERCLIPSSWNYPARRVLWEIASASSFELLWTECSLLIIITNRKISILRYFERLASSSLYSTRCIKYCCKMWYYSIRQIYRIFPKNKRTLRTYVLVLLSEVCAANRYAYRCNRM